MDAREERTVSPTSVASGESREGRGQTSCSPRGEKTQAATPSMQIEKGLGRCLRAVTLDKRRLILRQSVRKLCGEQALSLSLPHRAPVQNGGAGQTEGKPMAWQKSGCARDLLGRAEQKWAHRDVLMPAFPPLRIPVLTGLQVIVGAQKRQHSFGAEGEPEAPCSGDLDWGTGPVLAGSLALQGPSDS